MENFLKHENCIKYVQNNNMNNYYNFGTLIFIQNNKIIINEDNVEGFLLCKVNYGESVEYVIGKNTRLETSNCYKEFDSAFENYFLIFIKVVESIEKYAHIYDFKSGKYYAFKRIIYHNGELLDELHWAKPIPLINNKNELLWNSQMCELFLC